MEEIVFIEKLNETKFPLLLFTYDFNPIPNHGLKVKFLDEGGLFLKVSFIRRNARKYHNLILEKFCNGETYYVLENFNRCRQTWNVNSSKSFILHALARLLPDWFVEFT